MGIRKHYVTLCYKGIEVTVKETDGVIITTYEKPKDYGFKTVDLNIAGEIVSNDGFSPAELSFIRDFHLRNSDIMIRLVEGD